MSNAASPHWGRSDRGSEIAPLAVVLLLMGILVGAGVAWKGWRNWQHRRSEAMWARVRVTHFAPAIDVSIIIRSPPVLTASPLVECCLGEAEEE